MKFKLFTNEIVEGIIIMDGTRPELLYYSKEYKNWVTTMLDTKTTLGAWAVPVEDGTHTQYKLFDGTIVTGQIVMNKCYPTLIYYKKDKKSWDSFIMCTAESSFVFPIDVKQE